MQNEKTLWQIQKESKPKPEEIAKELKNPDDYKNLLKYLEFLNENNLKPRWQSVNKWSVHYKNKLICRIGINTPTYDGADGFDEGWSVSNNQFIKGFLFTDGSEIDDNLKKFIWNNIKTPPCSCKPNCGGIQNAAVFGRRFDAVCNCWPFYVKNPSGEQIKYLCELALTVKKFIS